MDEIVGATAAAILAGLFALGGSYLGTRFALSQYVAQRAHDLRLEWYIRAIREIGEVRHRAKDLVFAWEFDEAGRDEAIKAVHSAVTQLARTTAERGVFGTPSTIDFLDRMAEESERFNGRIEDLEFFREYLKLINTAHQTLSADARRQVFAHGDPDV